MLFIKPILVSVFLISILPDAALAGALGSAVERAALERVERTVSRRIAGKELAAGKKGATRALERSEGAEVCRAIPNKFAGIRREGFAGRVLQERYPSTYIQAETFFRTRTGRIAIDPVTRTGRRVDYSLFSDGKVVKRFEITSQFADKHGQIAMEHRIFERRANGSLRTEGIYARDRRTGKLVPVKTGPSEVMRFH